MPRTKKKSMSHSKKQTKNSRKFEKKSIGSKIQFWGGKTTKSKRPTTKSKRPTTKKGKTTKKKSKRTSVKKKSKNPTSHPDSVASVRTKPKSNEISDFNRDSSGVYAEPVNKIIMKSGKRYMEKKGLPYNSANSGYKIKKTSPLYAEILSPSYLEPEPQQQSSHKYASISNNGPSYAIINNSKNPSKNPTKNHTSNKTTIKKP